ncbi:hypothetical protein A2U01_0074264, partial [Trifolium medium]|nr:hypothetical protein [Trifolium medium]
MQSSSCHKGFYRGHDEKGTTWRARKDHRSTMGIQRTTM